MEFDELKRRAEGQGAFSERERLKLLQSLDSLTISPFVRFERQLAEQSRNSLIGSLRAIQEELSRPHQDVFRVFSKQSVAEVFAALGNSNALSAAALGQALEGAVTASKLAAWSGLRAAMEPSFVALRKGALEQVSAGLIEALAEARRSSYVRLGAMNGSAALAALAFATSPASVGIAKGIAGLQTSFAAQLADSLREVLSAAPDVEPDAARLETLIEAKISSLPQSRMSAEGLIAILLAVVSILIALYNADIDRQQLRESRESGVAQSRQLKRLIEYARRIAEHAGQLAPEHDENTYYVVERKVDLRLKPATKAVPFASLFPNQKVRLVQMNHHWIYVEYFDNLEGVPKYGWAKKKYLKRIE